MARWLTIFFLLGSFLFVFTGCSHNKLKRAVTSQTAIVTAKELNPVISTSGASKYKAEIDIFTRHFTGIIVLKQTDSLTKHLVFVTELGMRMFDFIIRGDSIRAAYVFEPLNKPGLINNLTADFRDILLVSIFNNKADYKIIGKKNCLVLRDKGHTLALFRDERNFANEIIVYSGKNKHSKINYLADYTSIKFRQKGMVKLKIDLNKIKEEH